MALLLTRVYPIIFPSLVSHCLSLGFETPIFLGPRISPTSFHLSYGFFLSLTHHPWASRTPSMNTCYPHTFIHGNPIRLYHRWKPCAASLFFELETISNSFCWVFFQDRCVGFIGFAQITHFV